MKTVHEVSEISGLSIRALHHYDAIGLLKPTKVTKAGYRLYDDDALDRLRTILIFRELGFALADIKGFLADPSFDRNEALGQHIKMLRMKREHIDALIVAADKMMKGEDAGFAAFDTGSMDKYAEEVKKRWGHTDAYRESKAKDSMRSDSDRKMAADGLMEQFAVLGTLRHLPADSDEVQAAVKALRDFISANYYECTDEILGGLGEMYAADESFRTSIDKAGGEGTAAFASDAIRIFCKI